MDGGSIPPGSTNLILLPMNKKLSLKKDPLQVGKTVATIYFEDGTSERCCPNREFYNPINEKSGKRLPGASLSEWKELVNHVSGQNRYKKFILS